MSIGRSRDLKPAPIAEITAKNHRASNRPLLFHRNGYEMIAGHRRKYALNEIALRSYLMKHGNIQQLFLHLDNDEADNVATERIINEYQSRYYVFDKRNNIGKDINDYLKNLANLKNSS